MASSDEGPTRMETTAVHWPAGAITVGMDKAGTGRSVVLLPALSSISTRTEMTPLLTRLASSFQVTTIDWPGFGDRTRPKADWSPQMLSSFLDWLLEQTLPETEFVIAAGHAAAYALYFAAHQPGRLKQLVLVAPTWRGPLPTMMQGSRPWFDRLVAAMDMPLLGPLLYRANVSRPVLQKMAREHVYDDPTFLAGERLPAKRAVVQAGGARHASVRFVTGNLDRVATRDELLLLVQQAALPILIVYGAGTPKKSLAEMEAMAACPGVEVVRLERGRLALHEEYPDEVATAIEQFLSR